MAYQSYIAPRLGARAGGVGKTGIDQSLVFDGSGAASGEILTVRTHGLRVGRVQGGRHQSAHIHLRCIAEKNAIGVDQPHMPCGIDFSQHLRTLRIQNAVKRHRILTRLYEVDGFIDTDIETAPFQTQQACVVLFDVGDFGADCASAADECATGFHDAACGLCE